MNKIEQFRQHLAKQNIKHFTLQTYEQFMGQNNEFTQNSFNECINTDSKNYCIHSFENKYLFLHNKIQDSLKTKEILNLKFLNNFFPQMQNFPIYDYQQQKIEELRNIEFLGKQLRKVIANLKSQHFSKDGLLVNYKDIDLENNEFQRLLTLLAFIKYENLIKDQNFTKAFFINIYNILNIHILTEYFKTHTHKNNISLLQKIKFFNKYCYNIGGYNFSLNDIEHGILRNNDNFQGDLLSFAKFYICGKEMSDKKYPRFSDTDVRRHLTIQLDPRIHFALNCGQMSCPPILTYDSNNIDDQLEKAAYSFINNETKIEGQKLLINSIFKFYKSDFGDLKTFIAKYRQDIQTETLQQLKIKFKSYNTKTNLLAQILQIIFQIKIIINLINLIMDNWCTIESDPVIFTELIHKYGSTDVQVSDVFVLDDIEALKNMGHIYGFIFLFKWDKDIRQQNVNIQYPLNMVFSKQMINNACATQAILSILLNQKDDFKIGEDLQNLKAFATQLDPESIGYSIGQCDNIRQMHNSFSRPEPFYFSSNKQKQHKEKEDVFHFVSYIQFENCLYELDGLQQGPILHKQNLQSYEEWLQATIQIINQRIKLYSEKEVRFHLLAVHQSHEYQIRKKIEINEQELFDIQHALQKIDESKVKNYQFENQLTQSQQKDSLSEQNLQDTQQNLISLLQDLQFQLKNLEIDNLNNIKLIQRKKHNYIPMIFELFKISAQQGVLQQRYEEEKKQLIQKSQFNLDMMGQKI